MSTVTMATIGYYAMWAILGAVGGFIAATIQEVVSDGRPLRLRWTPQTKAKIEEIEELLQTGVYSYAEAVKEWEEWYGAGVFGEPFSCPKWMDRFVAAAGEGMPRLVKQRLTVGRLLSEVNQRPGYGFDADGWRPE